MSKQPQKTLSPTDCQTKPGQVQDSDKNGCRVVRVPRTDPGATIGDTSVGGMRSEDLDLHKGSEKYFPNTREIL